MTFGKRYFSVAQFVGLHCLLECFSNAGIIGCFLIFTGLVIMIKRLAWVVLVVVFSLSLFPALANAQLSVPKSLVSLESPAGQRLLIDSHYKADYWPLSRYFVTQKTTTFCCIASLVMVMNSLPIARPLAAELAPYKLFTQTNFFYYPGVLQATTPERAHFGETLQKAIQLAKLFPVNVKAYHAKSATGFKAFMQRAKHVMQNPQAFLIINFGRKGIDEVGGGHFSPVAAYNQKANRFLIMDVARYKYPPVWVKAKALWHAMELVDTTSKQARGYLIISASTHH